MQCNKSIFAQKIFISVCTLMSLSTWISIVPVLGSYSVVSDVQRIDVLIIILDEFKEMIITSFSL